MAALTLGQAKIALRARLDEFLVNGSAWTDENLTEWINEGTRDIARRTETLHSVAAVSVLPQIQNVSLQTVPGIAKIERVEWAPNSHQSIYPLEYRDFHNMDEVWWTSQRITAGRPHTYTTKGYPPGLTIILFPKANESGLLNIYYDTVPGRLNDGFDDNVILSVPEIWDDLVLDYAEMRAFRTDNDPRWTSSMQLYEANVERMIERTRRWTQSAGMIQSSSGTMIPEWLWAG